MSQSWSGRRVQAARAQLASNTAWPTPCPHCAKPVNKTDRWVLGHTLPRSIRPDLTWHPANWRVEHRACSDASAQAVVIQKAKAEALAEHGINPAGFPGALSSEQPPLLPAHTHQSPSVPFEVRKDLTWANHCQSAPEWLQPFLEVPEDASPPLAMSPVHPEAVGTYAVEAIAWVKSELGIELRWWQRLAFARQLEHRDDGSLCWRTILESGPRRAGKSVRLRSMALWRIDHAELFGETQLAIHTGKDVAIVREIHRQAWAWASERPDWDVRKGVGQEEVRKGEVNRWLVRSTDSVYGYDTCLGMVDEAWAVEPAPFDEGLEPSTLERRSPQLLLTSTAHRKATSLMPKRLSAALAAEDGETLVLLWAALPTDDPSDPATWRKASPHWSTDRAKMIAAKFAAAQAGQADPSADDPDPFQAFLAQYLNVWRLDSKPALRGDALVDADAWEALTTEAPFDVPDAAAIESGFEDGVALALGWRHHGKAVVSVEEYRDLTEAVSALRDSGFRGPTTVGASLLKDPAVRSVRKKKGAGRTGQAVAELKRLINEDAFRHDGSVFLTDSVTSLRTTPGVDGLRILGGKSTHAVKAANWVAADCRQNPAGKPRILLPSSV